MDQKKIRRAFLAAFPHTLPILAGFGFIGLSYGILMSSRGFSFIYPMLMSLTVFAGSLEFVICTLLCSTFNPVAAFGIALMVQARHLFYGISMLDKYRDMGWKKWYLVFGLCDETFSINYTAEIPEGVDRGYFMFFVTLLNHSYWVAGSTLGGLLGSVITLDTSGIEFVMTAMFVVIFIEQLLKERQPYTAIIGGVFSLICLFIFGAEDFLIPSMLAILASLTLLRRPLERALSAETEGGGVR